MDVLMNTVGSDYKDFSSFIMRRNFPCFGTTNRFYEKVMEEGRRFIGGYICTDNVEEIIESFNSVMKNFRIEVRKKSKRLETHYVLPRDKRGGQLVKARMYCFEVVFNDEYSPKAKWCMTIPIIQFFRVAGVVYGQFFIGGGNDVESVLKKQQNLPYMPALWSQTRMSFNQFKCLDDIPFMNRVCDRYFDKIAGDVEEVFGFPVGTELCNSMLKEM